MTNKFFKKIFYFLCFSTIFNFFQEKTNCFQKKINFYEACTWFLRNLSMTKKYREDRTSRLKMFLEKKVLLEILQNLQENTCAKVSF